MWQASLESAVKNSIFIGCAAVADYRVAEVADQKIKKTNDNDELSLKLVKNPDIIASVASLEKIVRLLWALLLKRKMSLSMRRANFNAKI